MSPAGAAKSTAAKSTAATLPRLTAHRTWPTPGRDDGTVQAGSTSEGSAARSPRSPRSADPARVDRSWRFDPHSYNDPCNYLG